MNTDNHTPDEELANAVDFFYPTIDAETDYYIEAEREAFAKGANYQRKKDEVVIGALLNALKQFIDYADSVNSASDLFDNPMIADARKVIANAEK